MLLLNCNILFTSDPTLTKENLLLATDKVEMPNKAEYDDYLNMPEATYNELVRRHGTGKEGRQQLFSEFLSNHPFPTWEVVVQFLEELEETGKARAGLAQEVKEKYLTSE